MVVFDLVPKGVGAYWAAAGMGSAENATGKVVVLLGWVHDDE